MKYNYPITVQLIEELKLEYRNESKEKGNSWNTEEAIEYLMEKITEEYLEVKDIFYNHTNGYGNYPRTIIQEELKDLILVCSMLHEILRRNKK